MKKSQYFALDHYLSSYPDNTDFDSILEMIEQENEAVEIWQPFEYTPREQVTEYICHMAQELEEKFYPIVDAACIIDVGAIKEMLAGNLDREPNQNELDKVCEFVENDFIYQVSEKVSDAVTYCNIEK
jgi:hypothetical protein